MMIRAVGFAVGLFLCMCGGTLLYVDKLILFEKPPDELGLRGMLVMETIEQETRPVVDPADWMAFSLLSIGSVTTLYSVALPKRKK